MKINKKEKAILKCTKQIIEKEAFTQSKKKKREEEKTPQRSYCTMLLAQIACKKRKKNCS